MGRLLQPKKLQHLQEQSRWLNMEQNFHRVALTTFFRNSRNNVGVAMRANVGSGHECTGLNDGSKNSVTTTYLADAWNWGAEIFCGCEVRFVEQGLGGNGYTIYFAWHGGGRSEFKEDFKHQLFWIKAVSPNGNEYLHLCVTDLIVNVSLLRMNTASLEREL